jgi:hypothetical protein
MSGGFLSPLSVSGPQFADVIVGLEGIGLRAAARLLRQALAVLPSELPADHDARASLIDSLSDAQSARLGTLGGNHQELLPTDDILFNAIEDTTGQAPELKD